jgi:hypothetical protein
MDRLKYAGIAFSGLGAALFVFVLFLSAYWEPDIRWLHFFQSLMYCAAIVLMLRGNKLGCFIAIGAALFWDYVNLFVTTFLKNGLAQLHMFLSTEHMSRPDQFVSVPGWFGNLILLIGSLVVYSTLANKRWSDVARLAAAVTGTMAYFALCMYFTQPRYLALFPAALHPHLHI